MVKVVRKAGRPMCLGMPKDKLFSLAIAIHAGCLAILQADVQILGAQWHIILIAVNVVPMAMMLNYAQHKLTQYNQNIMVRRACMDVGGGSFYFGIDCVETETSNMFSDLSEDDGNSSWTDWRGYYKSTPASPNLYPFEQA